MGIQVEFCEATWLNNEDIWYVCVSSMQIYAKIDCNKAWVYGYMNIHIYMHLHIPFTIHLSVCDALHYVCFIDYIRSIVNTARPRRNRRLFPDDILIAFSWTKMFKLRLIFYWSLFPEGPINEFTALVQIMVCRRPGEKPLSEPWMVSLLTHICVAQPQWVKSC